MRIISLIIATYVVFVITTAIGCTDEGKKNVIKDIEQIDDDGSTNYRYIFREEIESVYPVSNSQKFFPS